MKALLLATAVGLAVINPVLAQAGHAGHGTAAKASEDVVNTGEVKRINANTKRVTIAHGPLKAFDMPAMTMAFAVKDPRQLARLKPGDKVNFVLEKSGEDLVVTRIEAVR